MNKIIQEEEKAFEDAQANKQMSKKVRRTRKMRGNPNHMFNPIEKDQTIELRDNRGKMRILNNQDQQTNLVNHGDVKNYHKIARHNWTKFKEKNIIQVEIQGDMGKFKEYHGRE